MDYTNPCDFIEKIKQSAVGRVEHEPYEKILDIEYFNRLNLLFFKYVKKEPLQVKVFDEKWQLITKPAYIIKENKCLVLFKHNVLAAVSKPFEGMKKILHFMSGLGVKLSKLHFPSEFLYKIVKEVDGELITAKFVMPTSVGVIELRGSNLLQTKTFKELLNEGKLVKIGFIYPVQPNLIRIVYVDEHGSVAITGKFDVRYSAILLDKILSVNPR